MGRHEEAAPRDVAELLERLSTDEQLWHYLSPYEFERVVGELLAAMGWEVSLTSQTRDGGIDILGISRDPIGFETSWIVECKRYAPNRPVGVAALRQLFGVQQSLRVPRALLVTTSHLTSDASTFLRQVEGLSVADLDVLRQWVARYSPPATGVSHAVARQFCSCFVSYSHHDEEFATSLVARLREEGVRVWFAPEDMRVGQKIHESIAAAIDGFDRLIIVLSDASMKSRWVQSEIRRARNRELREGVRVLFPISIVPFARVADWELFDADAGQDLAVEIREYLIPDFSSWRDSAMFDRQVRALLEGLKTDP